MDTNVLPKMNMAADKTGCCPEFNPQGWDGRHIVFEDQPFVRATTRALMHVPINMGSVFTRVQEHIEDAGAQAPDSYFVMSRDLSASEGEHLFAVTKDVPGEEMVRLSGEFIARVFEGPYRHAKTWDHDMRVAAEARANLATCGVVLDRPVEISLRDRIEGEIGNCLGLYHCGEDKIEILTPSALQLARESDSAFSKVSDSAYWESVIVHELTHAAYDTVTCPFSSCVATSEYASYAMQVWSLPEDERAVFGEGIELRTKPVRDAISAIVLFMSPNRFALLSWLHFEARPEPCGYMQGIMDGNIFFDREPL